ncbi:MAG: winged helix-turn-helix transcriptional regulator [Thermoanaerobacterales bacterium]|jgi:DNA-binding transcriptional ArsR family regulator|nr:winged helix-turn-helix transcriptional regulator [Thermoanaerobacterales bacterium]
MDTKQKAKYDARAKIFKALSSPVRLAILDYLSDGEKCVCHIVDHLEEKQSSISRHLSTLRDAGVVEARKEGVSIYYKLKTPCVINFFMCIDNVLKEQHEEAREIVETL